MKQCDTTHAYGHFGEYYWPSMPSWKEVEQEDSYCSFVSGLTHPTLAIPCFFYRKQSAIWNTEYNLVSEIDKEPEKD